MASACGSILKKIFSAFAHSARLTLLHKLPPPLPLVIIRAGGSSGSGGWRRARRGAPGEQDTEVLPFEPGVLGERAEQGLVERPDRQGTGNAIQHVRVNRHVRARKEQQREQDELHDRRCGLGVADQGGHRDAQRAEAGCAEDECQRDRSPVGGEGALNRLPMPTISATSTTLTTMQCASSPRK